MAWEMDERFTGRFHLVRKQFVAAQCSLPTEIRRRVDSHAAYLLSFSLLPETPSERLDGDKRRA
jgi:hypothetical protein